MTAVSQEEMMQSVSNHCRQRETGQEERQVTQHEAILFKLGRCLISLTAPPVVHVVSHPWHPDLEQRGLCELIRLSRHIDGKSHEAWKAVHCSTLFGQKSVCVCTSQNSS